MQEVTFTLQTITPLFMAGADQREVEVPLKAQKQRESAHSWEYMPEIRSSSFRGLMRYWLRAAVAGLISTEEISLEEVRVFEKHIFGTTDQGSSVQLRVTNISGNEEKFEKAGSSRFNVLGRDYLYWSMAESGKGNRYKPDRRYFLPGTSFNLVLSEHEQEKTQSRKLECAIAAIWLLITFGGIGSRSRRCAGSLTVTNVISNITTLSFAEVSNAHALQELIKQGLKDVRLLYISQLAQVKASMANGPYPRLERGSFDTIFLPNFCRIWILTRKNGSPWSKAGEAVDDIGKELQIYRSSISRIEQRAIFGLPLITRELQDTEVKEALENNRRASPLLLKIKKLQGEQYVGVAVLFKTKVQPIENLPEPNYSMIEEWIEKKLLRTSALEVTL